jgi:hypothetical protein
MNRFATLAAAAAVCCTFAAHAGMKINAADVPHISNGGTGYIGVTASAMTSDRMAAMSTTPTAATTTRTDWTPSMSQEAAATYDAAKTLGGSGRMSDPRMHRAWGTPD